MLLGTLAYCHGSVPLHRAVTGYLGKVVVLLHINSSMALFSKATSLLGWELVANKKKRGWVPKASTLASPANQGCPRFRSTLGAESLARHRQVSE